MVHCIGLNAQRKITGFLKSLLGTVMTIYKPFALLLGILELRGFEPVSDIISGIALGAFNT